MMMNDSRSSEERYPLLLLFLEDGQKTKNNRRIFFDKNHYKGIASGATTVITQWPGHVTSCWITALLCVLTIALLLLMVFATTLRIPNTMIAPKCHIPKAKQNTTIYLTHAAETWMPSQLITLQEIAETYRKCNIKIISLQKNIQSTTISSTTTVKQTIEVREKAELTNPRWAKRFRKSVHRRKRSKEFERKIRNFARDQDVEFNINVGTKKLLNMLLQKKHDGHDPHAKEREMKRRFSKSKVLNIEALLKRYPKIEVVQTTYEEVFQNSPLQSTFRNLNKRTLLFAVRSLYLWEYGGIGYDLPEVPAKVSTTKTSSSDKFKYDTFYTDDDGQTKNVSAVDSAVSADPWAGFDGINMENLIVIGKTTFDAMPEGVVTIDDDGLHMETKTTCHAFFIELLMKLKDATATTLVSDIIRKTLKVFCKRGAADSGYCNNLSSTD